MRICVEAWFLPNQYHGLSEAFDDWFPPLNQGRYLSGNPNFQHRRLGFARRHNRCFLDFIEIGQALGIAP
jgi:hypothetical protein